jgi:hypothetical protein
MRVPKVASFKHCVETTIGFSLVGMTRIIFPLGLQSQSWAYGALEGGFLRAISNAFPSASKHKVPY